MSNYPPGVTGREDHFGPHPEAEIVNANAIELYIEPHVLRAWADRMDQANPFEPPPTAVIVEADELVTLHLYRPATSGLNLPPEQR